MDDQVNMKLHRIWNLYNKARQCGRSDCMVLSYQDYDEPNRNLNTHQQNRIRKEFDPFT